MHRVRGDARTVCEHCEEPVRLHPRLDDQAFLSPRSTMDAIDPLRTGPGSWHNADVLRTQARQAMEVLVNHRHASIDTSARSEPLIIFHAPCVSPPATTMLISAGSKIRMISSGAA